MTTEEVRARLDSLAGDRERMERIALLLEHYQDVLEGITDGERSFAGPGDGLALMCEAWNHPSYRQLERLRAELAEAEPRVYWHVAELYLRAGRKRVAYCPRCRRQDYAALIGKLCSHGQKPGTVKSTDRVPRVVRVVSHSVDAAMVAFGVAWIESRWQGGVFVPEDILAIEGRRAPKRERRVA